MKMVAGLVVLLFTAFALPSAFASFETKDFITRRAYENLVKSGAIESITMTKTIISSPILEEALVAYSNHKLGGGTIFDCGETCLLGTCYTPGCSCGEYKFCYGTNSLEQNSNKAEEGSLLEAALVTFAKKGLGGMPICGETCVQGKCYTPGCTCNWPVCERNTLAI